MDRTRNINGTNLSQLKLSSLHLTHTSKQRTLCLRTRIMYNRPQRDRMRSYGVRPRGIPCPRFGGFSRGRTCRVGLWVLNSDILITLLYLGSQNLQRSTSKPQTDCTFTRWRNPMPESMIVGLTRTRTWFPTSNGGSFDSMFSVSQEILLTVFVQMTSWNVLLDAPFFVDDRIVFYGYDLGVANLSCNVMADPPATISWSAANPKVPQKCFTIHNETNSSELEVFVISCSYLPPSRTTSNPRFRSFLETNESMGNTLAEPRTP